MDFSKVGVRRGLSLLLFRLGQRMFKSGPLALAVVFCASGVLQVGLRHAMCALQCALLRCSTVGWGC